MKIMVQNRAMIVEQPRCIWVEPRSEPEDEGVSNSETPGGVIASNVRRAPVLGEYSTMKRALEVLNEIFEYQRRGKVNYYMPEE